MLVAAAPQQGLDAASAEAVVAELASDGTLHARIDRPAGVVVFARPRPAAETLTDWGADVATVLGLLEKTQHLILKEALLRDMQAAAARA